MDHSVQCSCVCVCVFQVGQAKDNSLTNQLIDYLMGESDGMPKVIYTPALFLLPFDSVAVSLPATWFCCDISGVKSFLRHLIIDVLMTRIFSISFALFF